MKIINVDNLTKSFKEKVILKEVTFSVSKNSFHALIGENGAGKTTLINSILRFYTNYSGNIKINNISNLNSDSRNNIFFMPSHLQYPSSTSIYKFIDNFCILKKINKNLRSHLISKNLKEFNLWEVRKQKINKLSSGQSKKVYLICAIISSAELLILDEPTANLDPNTRKEIYLIFDLLRKNGATIFISTHNLAEISSYVTESSFLGDGKILWSGKIPEGKDLEKHYFSFIKGNISYQDKKGGENEN